MGTILHYRNVAGGVGPGFGLGLGVGLGVGVGRGLGVDLGLGFGRGFGGVDAAPQALRENAVSFEAARERRSLGGEFAAFADPHAYRFVLDDVT